MHSRGNTIQEKEFISSYNTVSTYKDKRREGHGVISSSASAGAELLLSESLGFGQYMALSLVRELHFLYNT